MEAIRTYGCAEEGLETEVTITDLGHGHGNQKLVFNKKFIHKLNFDYFANIYAIKGYFPNNNYDETFEGVKLNRWASCGNDSKKAIRKINIRWVQGDQAVRELTFNAYALAYKEELTREGHYFYLILRDVNQKISHNNIILAPQDDIIYLTVNPYKENTSLILLLKRLEERYNFAGQLKGDYSLLGDLPRKKFSNKNSILKADYWEFELWVSATTKEMKRIFFELNVYFSSKGYDGLVDDGRPLNLLRKLIGAIGGSIAERIHNGVGIIELKKGDLTFLFSDFKEKLRKLIKNKEIIFKPNFNSITLTQDRESHIGGGFAGSNLSSTQQSTSQQNLNSSYSPTSTVETTNNKQVKDEEVKRKKKEEVKVRTKSDNDKKEDNNVIGISYNYQDGEAVQEAKYIVQDLAGNKLAEGRLDKAGKATVTGLPEGEVEVILGEDNREYEPIIKPKVNPYYNPSARIEEIFSKAEKVDETPWYEKAYNKTLSGLKAAINWTVGVLAGDLEENPTTGQIITRTLITMIPIVDQVADFEDVVANLFHLCDKKEENNKAAWIALILTAVGCIPILGSACKGVFKIVLKKADNLLRDDVLKLLRKFGKGDPVAFIKKIDWNKLIKETTENLTEIFEHSISAFKKIKNKIPGISKFDNLIAKVDDIIKRLESLERQIDNRVAEVFAEIKGRLDNLFEGNQLVPATAGGNIRVKTVPEKNLSKMDNLADDAGRRVKKTEVKDGNIKARTDEAELKGKGKGFNDDVSQKNMSEDSGSREVRKTGLGKTGEGIPLDEVKPAVLKQIHPDNTGAYGYLPKEGTRYAKYDFTDVEMAKKNRLIREEYLEQSKKIQNEINKMVEQGAPKDDIADYVVNMRNQDKVVARAKMTAEEVAELEAGNMKRYGNPVGPDANWLFNKKKKDLLRKGMSATDDKIWQLVIEGSMRKDDVINTLLGIKH